MIGNGGSVSVYLPTLVTGLSTGLSNVASIIVTPGLSNTASPGVIALTNDGTVYRWGVDYIGNGNA